MIGKQERWQEDLFVAGPLSSLIPGDHILKRVDAILDLAWLPALVKDTYCTDNGRRSIDPEAALRLMMAGFFEGITQDRKLMRQAQVNLAMRWFAGYRLHESLPDHSSLTRIRQRWGAERFKQIFQRIVRQCVDAGLVGGKTVHIDATLIRADVSWESLVQIHADKVLEENPSTDESPDDPTSGKTKSSKPQKRSTTDPDATMSTSCKTFHMEPSYKQHGAVDDQCGVIVDIDVTTGQANEGNQLPEQIERIETNTGQKPETVTADKGYAHGANYAHLEQEQIEAIIPPSSQTPRSSCIPSCRFKYDAKHRIVKCPAKQILTYSSTSEKGDIYRADSKDCQRCSLRQRCFSSQKARCRTILIGHGYEALLRARRVHARNDEHRKKLYTRHRWRVEGVHGQAKVQHGLRRAARRGLWNVAIQAYLTAVVMNLKRLAAVLLCFCRFLGPIFVMSGFQNCRSVVEKRNWIRTESILRKQAA